MAASFEQPNASVNESPNYRPSLPRSNSIPSCPKNASMVSLKLPSTLQTPAIPAPSLKKRHSAYALPTPDRAKIPVPVTDPPAIRPLRNPVLGDPVLGDITSPAPLPKEKEGSKGLPSLTTGAQRDGKLIQASPVASDKSSPVSTRSRQSLATGPVSEVAPWEMYPVRRSATSHSSLTSGYVDEVTPWELHPVPTIMPNRSTLATGPLEDVTPWELDSAPPSTELSASEKQFSTRSSTSSNQGKSPSDVKPFRRRKSTSAKAAKPRFTFFASSFSTGHPSGSRNPPLEDVESSIESASKVTHIASSRARLPPSVLLPKINGYDTPTESRQNLEFLPADPHFIVKGEGTSSCLPLAHRGKKHHAFPPEKIPYPRNYEREVVDLDVWETTSCQDIFESLGGHVFKTQPTKVLDLGCGTGTWILNCAKAWKNCHFVGLDIVPLQPDLYRVGSLDLASRITWVHASFLENLPFPDDEFDFVHIKRIALGIPENKWDGLFQEIIRVMKPGGIFEMLEEDIFFPGKLMNINEDINFESEKQSLVLSSHPGSTKSYSDANFESLVDSGAPSFRSIGHSPPTSTTTTSPATPPRSNSPDADVVISEDMEKEAREILSYAIGDDYILPPEEASYYQVPNDTMSPATTRAHLQVKTPQSVFASSMVSLNPSSGSAAPPDSETSFKSKTRTRSRAHSLSLFLSSATNSQQSSPVSEIEPTTHPVPLLPRTIPKPPPNPRDHSLLEVIYTRLLKSRSINMTPLALLADHIGYYFQDVRTHPPLHHYFPVALENCPSDHDEGGNRECSETEGSSSDDSDDARDAILPSPVPRTLRRKISRRKGVSISEKYHHVCGRGLIHHRSAPYLTLNESNASTLSSSIKGMFPDTSSASPRHGFFLPNTTMHLDSKPSNLHLALRAAEIVACSEAMWEWVQKFSAKVKAYREREAAGRPASRPYRSGSGSIEMPTRMSNTFIATSSADPYESSILDLTREEFDGLISKFEMDMWDICDVQGALRDRLSWHIPEPTVSTEREAFQKACEKWEKWEQEQLLAPPSHVRSHDQIRHPPSGAYGSAHSSAAGNRIRGRSVSMEQSKKRVSNTSGPPLRLSRSMRIFLARKSDSVPPNP